MIIIGYPGIGKTTLSIKNNRFIDLESSLFTVNGDKIDNWYLVYCNIAKDISRQGNDVFVSCHEDVVKTLELMKDVEGDSLNVIAILPEYNQDMMDKWIVKLKDRYEDTKLDKHKRAYDFVKSNYGPSILSILKRNIPCVMVTSLDYDLEYIIERI